MGRFLAAGLPICLSVLPQLAYAAHPASFPPSLESYGDAQGMSLWQTLVGRVEAYPFNLWATAIFFAAILHTFLVHRFRLLAHHFEERHQEHLMHERASGRSDGLRSVSVPARIFHFFGEVEVVFGLWLVPLFLAIYLFAGGNAARTYVNEQVNFVEPVFVVVIMAIALTRPILTLAERAVGCVALLGRRSPAAWWISLLAVGPLLGSFVTEPAAMTICASLLSRKFYSLNPSRPFAYATLGLLFVAVSVGGTLTHFAAPPVIMVADAWGWDTPYMLTHFGVRAALGILLSVAAYALFFRKELAELNERSDTAGKSARRDVIPLWVTGGHLLFLLFVVFHSHDPIYLIFALLLFLGFVRVTEDFQRDFRLNSPILVGLFLGALVVHGGLQQWWIAPVLGRLTEVPLFLGATILTAFNDNAAITYLCTLVPTFTEGLKYAAMAGAVVGGGLTVIANAPNPAGQSILEKHFDRGISPLGLFLGAAAPTLIVGLCFLLVR